MTQTISAQRGNTSITANSYTTLYTNSASGSSRVIINSMALFSTTDNTFIASGLFLTNTGGGTPVPIALARSTVSANYALIYIPGTVPVGSNNNTAGNGFVVMVNTSNPNSSNPNELTLNYSGTSNASAFAYCPKSFWVGPSDAIQFRQTNNNTSALTLVYNLTVITET